MNIVWKRTDGGYSVTHVADGSDPVALAAILQADGFIDAGWALVSTAVDDVSIYTKSIADAVNDAMLMFAGARDSEADSIIEFTTAAGATGVFRADRDSRHKLLETITAIGYELPDNFYMQDVMGVKIPFAFADLCTLNQAIWRRAWAIEQHYDDRLVALRGVLESPMANVVAIEAVGW